MHYDNAQSLCPLPCVNDVILSLICLTHSWNTNTYSEIKGKHSLTNRVLEQNITVVLSSIFRSCIRYTQGISKLWSRGAPYVFVYLVSARGDVIVFSGRNYVVSFCMVLGFGQKVICIITDF